MARHSSHRFEQYWHKRSIELGDGDVLSWTLIDDPRHLRPHTEFGAVTSSDGYRRLLHPIELRRLLDEHDHPDVEHVRTELFVGIPFTH